MCVIKTHAFTSMGRPPSWSGTLNTNNLKIWLHKTISIRKVYNNIIVLIYKPIKLYNLWAKASTCWLSFSCCSLVDTFLSLVLKNQQDRGQRIKTSHIIDWKKKSTKNVIIFGRWRKGPNAITLSPGIVRSAGVLHVECGCWTEPKANMSST